jgi:hypothetical protein
VAIKIDIRERRSRRRIARTASFLLTSASAAVAATLVATWLYLLIVPGERDGSAVGTVLSFSVSWVVPAAVLGAAVGAVLLVLRSRTQDRTFIVLATLMAAAAGGALAVVATRNSVHVSTFAAVRLEVVTWSIVALVVSAWSARQVPAA